MTPVRLEPTLVLAVLEYNDVLPLTGQLDTDIGYCRYVLDTMYILSSLTTCPLSASRLFWADFQKRRKTVANTCLELLRHIIKYFEPGMTLTWGT